MKAIANFVSRIDLLLVTAVFALCAVGLMAQYSAGGLDSSILWNQGTRIGFALCIMCALASVRVELLYRYTPHIYVAVFVLLLLVLFIGVAGRGAQRWLDLGIARFQPAELMKVVLPMMIGWLLTRSQLFNRNLSLAIAGVLVVVPVALVYLQPDLGTALLIAAVGVFAIYLGGISWRTIGVMSVVGIAAIPLSWPLLHEYQRLRVITLFDPWKDPLGTGYHSIQSMIAIGSGGFVGKGWLNGSQSQLDFIPERSTDFIYSVFAEEFGLIGGVCLIAVYAVVMIRCFVIGYKSNSEFGRIVAGSVAILVLVHLFVNIGMVSGMLPVVGVPLPFLSYGGTSMVTVLAGLGLVMGVRNATRT